MLRAQLEQRKKAILERINKEGKDKLEKVCKFLKGLFFFFLRRVLIKSHLKVENHLVLNKVCTISHLDCL